MDKALDLSFAALTALFTVWNAIYIFRLFSYRRLQSTGELTWYPERPWFYGMCLGIGLFMTSLTLVSIFVLSRPLLSVVAQALMAIYYAVLFPLSFRIQRGFFQSGIWTEAGFVPYGRVRALNWIERPEIVLVLRSDGGPFRPSYARLRVPGDRYGQARRILASHIDDRSLSVEKSILGLSDAETPAQEQV